MSGETMLLGTAILIGWCAGVVALGSLFIGIAHWLKR